jgi:hypothetical protein
MAKAPTTMSYEPHFHTPVTSISNTGAYTQLYPSGDGPGGARLVGISGSNDFNLQVNDDGLGNELFCESSSQGPFWIFVDSMDRIWVKGGSTAVNITCISYHVNQAAPVH